MLKQYKNTIKRAPTKHQFSKQNMIDKIITTELIQNTISVNIK